MLAIKSIVLAVALLNVFAYGRDYNDFGFLAPLQKNFNDDIINQVRTPSNRFLLKVDQPLWKSSYYNQVKRLNDGSLLDPLSNYDFEWKLNRL